MYNGHIDSHRYRQIKQHLADIINGDVENYDIEKIADKVQSLYDSGELSSSQYDDLFGYIQELM